MSNRRVWLATLLAIAVVGCRYIGADIEPSSSPSGPATAAPSAVATFPEPSASLVPTDIPAADSPAPETSTEPGPTAPVELPSPTVSEPPTPSSFDALPLPTIVSPTSHDIDAFWSQFLELSCVELGMEDDWDSVTQMTKDVEVVAVAHPVAVEYRRGGPYDGIGVVRMAIDELIKGDPRSTQAGVIDITDFGEGEYYGTGPQAPIPVAPTLLFLRNEALSDQRYNQTVQPGDEYLYYMPAVHQNVLTEIDGKVYVPQTKRMTNWYGSGFFPLPLSGMSWDNLLDEVRNAANQAAKPSDVQFGIRAAC